MIHDYEWKIIEDMIKSKELTHRQVLAGAAVLKRYFDLHSDLTLQAIATEVFKAMIDERDAC